jgi:hypothetical protein
MATLTDGQWSLFYRGNPWSINAERSMHMHARGRLIREWRAAFAGLARELHIPRCDAITVTATPFGVRQDVANCLPAVKAAIDGLVDARVVADDDPTHVVRITFMAPRMHIEARPLGLELHVARFTAPH